jgi:hypothetical protein
VVFPLLVLWTVPTLGIEYALANWRSNYVARRKLETPEDGVKF